MENAITAGQELGYLNIPKDSLIDQNEINNYPPEKVLIMCVLDRRVNQWQALSRIANGTHRQITIQPEDTVVFSSSLIQEIPLALMPLSISLKKAGLT